MNNSSGIIVGILVVIVIAIVGWIAYSQGFFNGQAEEDQDFIEVNLGEDQQNNNPY